MKKVISIFLVLAMCLSLCACEKNEAVKNVEAMIDTLGEIALESINAIRSAEDACSALTEAIVPETTSFGPPEDEYTEIILHDDRYFLCKKVQSGFSENGEYYGIYDAINCIWALEYSQYDTHDLNTLNFINHGCGVFSYKYSSYYGTRMFLSADMGYVFKTDTIYNPETVKFYDGRAIALLHDEPSQTYVNGMIAPDIRLVWLDTYGTVSDVAIPGFNSDDLIYWYESVLTGESDQDKIYANCFYNYNTGSCLYYIFVYHFEDGSTTLIGDQEYVTRLQKYLGDSPSNSNITIRNGIIRIDQLEGDDGKLYYAEFSKDGNLVTPATPMN